MPANISIPQSRASGLKSNIADWALDKGLSFVFNKWLKRPLQNHKTTGAGVLAILAGLSQVVTIILGWADNQPIHAQDIVEAGAAIAAGFGLIAARDFDKTSRGELAVIDGHVIPKALPVEG